MRRHKVGTTKACNPSRAQFCRVNAKQELQTLPTTLPRQSRPIASLNNEAHLANVTVSTGQSHLRRRRGLDDVTEARPAPAYCETVNCRSRPPSRKWDHRSGALCSAFRGPPPSSCTSTGPEGPGSASRPRPHPRRHRRHHRCHCSLTPSPWPRCLRWGRCGRVCAGRLPVAARVLAVRAYVDARLHPAPDACDFSGT